MRHPNALMFVALLLLPLPALAERAPQTMGQDARVRSVWYNPSDVIRVDTNLRTNTALELGRGERIEQVLLGDSEAFDVEVLSNRNTVSVKPVIGSAHSNMTIYTSRRAIAFVLTEGRSKTPTYRVAVKYPVYGRPRGCKRFFDFGNSIAVEFLRVSGLWLRPSMPRALMVSSRNRSKTRGRSTSYSGHYWFSHS